MSTVESPGKRGRPPGEVTPEALIRAELIAHLKLYKRLREFVETRIDSGELDPESLGKYMELIRKGIVEMAKPVLPNAKATDVKVADETEDAESILTRLIRGDTRK